MASSSSMSPKKLIFQTVNPNVSELKLAKKNSLQLSNESQHLTRESGAYLPDPNSENEDMLIDQKEVLSKHLSSEKPNLKVYIRLVDKKNNSTLDTKDQNLESNDTDVAAALAVLANQEEEKVRKTWNLRPRKPIKCNEEASTTKIDVPSVELKTIPEEGSRSRLPRSCTMKKKLKEPKMEIALTLSKEEIEQDLLALTGKKPARRPKKRPRSLQKQLDIITPGSFLDSLSAEAYQV